MLSSNIKNITITITVTIIISDSHEKLAYIPQVLNVIKSIKILKYDMLRSLSLSQESYLNCQDCINPH